MGAVREGAAAAVPGAGVPDAGGAVTAGGAEVVPEGAAAAVPGVAVPDAAGACPDVSVIVPVYNGAAHIEQCLRSVLGEPGTPVAAAGAGPAVSLEVICIDDASTDGTAELVERLAQAYEQAAAAAGAGRPARTLALVRQERNGGVSAARNAGLARARGRYVGFVDGDDFVAEGAFGRVVAEADRLAAQVAIYGFDEFFEATGAFVPRAMFADPAYVGRAFSLDELRVPACELVTPNVWRILYSRTFLQSLELRFHEDLATSEDLAFIYESLPYAKRICVVPQALCHYRRDGGQTLTRGERGLAGFRALAYVRACAERRGMPASFMRHFLNLVLDVAEYAMWSAATHDDFRRLFDEFSARWLGVAEAHLDLVAERYQRVVEEARGHTAEEYLFALYARERAACEWERSRAVAQERECTRLAQEVGERAAAAASAVAETERVRSSWAFKVGRAATFVPSQLKARLTKQ